MLLHVLNIINCKFKRRKINVTINIILSSTLSPQEEKYVASHSDDQEDGPYGNKFKETEIVWENMFVCSQPLQSVYKFWKILFYLYFYYTQIALSCFYLLDHLLIEMFPYYCSIVYNIFYTYININQTVLQLIIHLRRVKTVMI